MERCEFGEVRLPVCVELLKLSDGFGLRGFEIGERGVERAGLRGVLGGEQRAGERRRRGAVFCEKRGAALPSGGDSHETIGECGRDLLRLREKRGRFEFEQMAQARGGFAQRLVRGVELRELVAVAARVRMQRCASPMKLIAQCRGVEPRTAREIEDGEGVLHGWQGRQVARRMIAVQAIFPPENGSTQRVARFCLNELRAAFVFPVPFPLFPKPMRRVSSKIASLFVLCVLRVFAGAAESPNVIFIMADDLGYGELGSYGQRLIQTPNLDRMAAEGLRFTQFYAGSTVCAPSRCVLMTGRHVGHATVRGNAGKGNTLAQTLRAEDVTIASVLKKGGYATGLIGKWGLGELGTGGEPTKQGFDTFFGYLNQSHAHNYYPAFLVQNEEVVRLKNVVPGDGEFGGGVATEKLEYSPDLFRDEALKWIEEKKDAPFFLYLALTTPHANNEAGRTLKNGQEVPELGAYADKDWTPANKGQAAMITRMDRDIGQIFELLKKLQLDEKTLVIFTSDNGPHKEGANDPAFFNASGGLRGIKRDLYEGGIRVPFIARWPGKIAPGQVTKHVGYFGDVFATLSDLAGVKTPPNLDSVSIAPLLLGQAEKQSKHEFLYWEFHERGTKQAVLLGANWKGVRISPGAKLELYDLANDPGETQNVADDRPEIASVIESYLRTARTESPDWPIAAPPKNSAPAAAAEGN